MDSIFQAIKTFYDQADEEGRKDVQRHVRDLQVSFYSDWDVVMRLSSGPLQLAIVRIGIDLGLFDVLQKSNEPVTLSRLAETTGAATHLLGRILRTLAAFGFIKETDKYTYEANGFTGVLAEPNAAGAISHLFDVSGPVNQIMPDFLKGRSYQNIISNKDTIFQKAFDTQLTLSEWMPEHPEHMKNLGKLIALQRANHWVDTFPMERELKPLDVDSEKPVLVDMGGGFSGQSVIFRNKFPDLKGRRVIVQDIPQTLAQARPADGVEFLEHDFFQAQTVRGAKFYYLRHILHDWPDDKCSEILRNIIPAMDGDSRIIIDEVVLPETGTPWQSAYMDFIMMGALGALERTRSEWEALLDLAGLKTLYIHQYDQKMQASVIVAVPK